jgi:hypothetical protein
VSEKEAYHGWQIGLPKVAEYRKGEKKTYSEADCLKCGRSFSPERGQLIPALAEQTQFKGTAVVQTRLGVEVQGEIIADDAAVNVSSAKGIVTAHSQVLVQFKEAMINMDSPLFVIQSGTPIGIMWAMGSSREGYSMGIVQPIASLGLRGRP